MVCQFGDFELDESGRSLRLRGRALGLQPKIFDLLVYLLRHAGRVVTKHELMEHLWPEVHVTESSLQRAVSLLRKTLREGGLTDALKSFAGHGYRLAVDHPNLDALLPGGAEPPGAGAAARAAATERDWSKVIGCLAACSDSDLAAEDFELWAITLECLGRPGDASPMLRNALERYEAQGDRAPAARCAITLAKIHLERAEAAVARGWLARAALLLKHQEPSDAAIYLLWMQARFEAFDGRPEAALDVAERASAIAEKHGSVPLRALTLGYLGFFNISLGHTRIGLEQQDHAAAQAMSSAVDPVTGSLIYCNILWSCRCFADWSRANQWADGFETWCKANFAGTTGSCELHRAEILGSRGTLADALIAVNNAMAKLPNSEPWALGDAYRVRGDIHAASGDLDAALSDYRSAYAAGWDAEPGNAVLLFQAGDVDGAISALDRVLASVGWFGLQRRGLILAHKARICAWAGRSADARASIDMLAAQFDGWPSPAIRALATEAEASLAATTNDDPQSAMQFLQLARQLWTSIGAELDAARVRLNLARLLTAKGDLAGALVEIDCAHSCARRIGARLLERECAEIRAELVPKPINKAPERPTAH